MATLHQGVMSLMFRWRGRSSTVVLSRVGVLLVQDLRCVKALFAKHSRGRTFEMNGGGESSEKGASKATKTILSNACQPILRVFLKCIA